MVASPVNIRPPPDYTVTSSSRSPPSIRTTSRVAENPPERTSNLLGDTRLWQLTSTSCRHPPTHRPKPPVTHLEVSAHPLWMLRYVPWSPWSLGHLVPCWFPSPVSPRCQPSLPTTNATLNCPKLPLHHLNFRFYPAGTQKKRKSRLCKHQDQSLSRLSYHLREPAPFIRAIATPVRKTTIPYEKSLREEHCEKCALREARELSLRLRRTILTASTHRIHHCQSEKRESR